MPRRSIAPQTRVGTWPGMISRGLLILAVPLLLVAAWTLLVAWPSEVIGGLAETVSGRDVIQVADGMKTGFTLYLMAMVIGAVWWFALRRMPFDASPMLLVYAIFLFVPIMAVLGVAAEYGLQGALAWDGYDYCTFHVTETGKGSSGRYVYVRRGLSDGCSAVQAMFPAGRRVPDQTAAFDLPAP